MYEDFAMFWIFSAVMRLTGVGIEMHMDGTHSVDGIISNVILPANVLDFASRFETVWKKKGNHVKVRRRLRVLTLIVLFHSNSLCICFPIILSRDLNVVWHVPWIFGKFHRIWTDYIGISCSSSISQTDLRPPRDCMSLIPPRPFFSKGRPE